MRARVLGLALPGPSTPRRRCRPRRRRRRRSTRIVGDRRSSRRDARRRATPSTTDCGSSYPAGDATRTCTPEHRPRRARATPRRCCRRRRTSACGPASDPEPLPQRQHVGQRLARMLLVGERVDDVQTPAPPRRTARAAPARTCGRRRHRTQRSRLRATSSTVSRPPNDDVGGGSMTSPPSSRTAIANVDPRPQRRLLEEQRDVLAGERLAPAGAGRAARSRFTASARSSTRSSSAWLRSRTDRKSLLTPRSARSLGALRVAHVRYSALMRTYSALKSHVHIVAACGPPVPRSTVTSMSLRLQHRPRPRRRVRRAARPRRRAATSPIDDRRARRGRTRRPIGRPPRSSRPQFGSPP